MIAFVDTSAFLAVLDQDDKHHTRASRKWSALIEGGATLVCTSYVLCEIVALLQHRLGMDAVRVFHDDIMPLLVVEWVSAELHRVGVAGVLAARRRDLSLVDCVSFEVMRHQGIQAAFAFDKHFREQGFVDVS